MGLDQKDAKSFFKIQELEEHITCQEAPNVMHEIEILNICKDNTTNFDHLMEFFSSFLSNAVTA